MDGQCVLLAMRPPHGCLWHESFDVAGIVLVVVLFVTVVVVADVVATICTAFIKIHFMFTPYSMLSAALAARTPEGDGNAGGDWGLRLRQTPNEMMTTKTTTPTPHHALIIFQNTLCLTIYNFRQILVN